MRPTNRRFDETLDPRYLFHFVNRDMRSFRDRRVTQRRWRTHVRHVYWESLYAFSPFGKPVVVAARVVPHTHRLWALYLILRRHMGKEGKDEKREPQLLQTQALVRSVSALAKHGDVALPQGMQARADELVLQALSRTFSEQSQRGGLEIPIDAILSPGLGEQEAPVPRIGGGGQVRGNDVAWVKVGDDLFGMMRDAVGRACPSAHSQALVRTTADRRKQPASRLFEVFYSRPEVQNVIARVMRARGGFASSLVQHFLGMLYGMMLDEGPTALGMRDSGEPFWKERLDGIIGRAEADAMESVLSYELTILGRIVDGSLRRNEVDPEQTDRFFQAAPNTDPGAIVLRDIRGASRIPVHAFVAAMFPNCADAIRWIGAQ